MSGLYSRRSFLVYSGGALAGAASGCMVQDGSDAAVRLALKVLGVELLALELTIHQSSVSYSYLTNDASPRLETDSVAISPSDLGLLRSRPVAVVTDGGRSLTGSLFSRSGTPFRLAGQSWSEVTYRCPVARGQYIHPAARQRVGMCLAYLNVDAEFETDGRGRTLVIYGGNSDWQAVHLGSREVAGNWRNELRAAGFETRLS
jgi:hypothetical protein